MKKATKKRIGLFVITILLLSIFTQIIIGHTGVATEGGKAPDTMTIDLLIERGTNARNLGYNFQIGEKSIADTNEFSSCGPGGYAVGFKINSASAQERKVQIKCNYIGRQIAQTSENPLIINNSWQDVSKNCAGGRGIYNNTAISYSLEEYEFGCDGTYAPECNYQDNETCTADSLCKWEFSRPYCSGQVKCNRLDNETLCKEVNCHWEDSNQKCKDPGSRNPKPCTDYSENQETCEILGCDYIGTVVGSCTNKQQENCATFLNLNTCEEAEGCYWKPLNQLDKEQSNELFICSNESSIINAIAGFGGNYTQFCPQDLIPGTDYTYSGLYASSYTGLLPKCNSPSQNCAYRFKASSCFWMEGIQDNEYVQCPEEHYLAGLQSYLDLDSICETSDVKGTCARAYCCTVNLINHSLENGSNNGIDDDCDGFVDEGYNTENETKILKSYICPGDSNIVLGSVVTYTCTWPNLFKSSIFKDELNYYQHTQAGEGHYYINGSAVSAEMGGAAVGGEFAYIFSINFDENESDCDGLNTTDNPTKWLGPNHFNQGLSSSCCGDDNNETLKQGDDTTWACCNESKDIWVRNGTCYHTELYWANMNNKRINRSDFGDTVKLVVINTDKTSLTKEIYEKDGTFNEDDWIRTITKTNVYFYSESELRLTQDVFNKSGNENDAEATGNLFYFKINSETKPIFSGNLKAFRTMTNNSFPNAVIVTPQEASKYIINNNIGKTQVINFTQICSDEDDNLQATWFFGDRTNRTISDCLTTGNCNTTYQYVTTGTKDVELLVKEKERWQENTDSKRIFVYGTGINIFALLNASVEDKVVFLDLTGTHVANCSNTSPECQFAKNNNTAKAITDCYEINDSIDNTQKLYCYNLRLSNTNVRLFWTSNGQPINPVQRSFLGEYTYVYAQLGQYNIKINVAYNPSL